MMRLLYVVALIPLVGCETAAHKVAPTVSNPASVNCLQQGGDLVVRVTSGGQKAYCLLHDGRSLDAWEFYRQTHP